MSDDMQGEKAGDGLGPSAFDRALTLTAHQAHLLGIARALIAEQRETRASLVKRLRADVVAYTAELRDEGVPPERVVALVKAAVTPALTVPVDERRDLMDSIVRWCVEAYYAA